MMDRHLHSYFPSYFTDGAIFSKMTEAPWQSAQAGLEMDIVYLGSHSGIKPAAYFINQFITDDILDEQQLANVLWKIFGTNWQRLWDAYMAEYDPLNNYSIEESIKREESSERTIDKDVSENGTVNSTDKYDSTTEIEDVGHTESDGKSTTDYGKKSDGTAKNSTWTHAFNTADAVPTGVAEAETHNQDSGSDTTTDTSMSDSSREGSTVVDAKETAESITATKTEEDTTDKNVQSEEIVRTRKGNIGQNTYQELLRQEFELWKFNFYRQVFSDCDSVLCISVFSGFCDHTYDRFSTVN